MENKNIFDQLVIENSTVGVHGISGKRSLDGLSIDDITDSILSDGLTVTDWGGFLSNIVLLGDKEEFTFFEAYGYKYPSNISDINYNIIVSIPKTITDRYNNTYFLGDLPRTIDSFNPADRGIDNEITKEVKFNPINKYVIDSKLFPKELIVGYTKNNNGDVSFVPNPKYIGNNKELEFDFVDKLNPSKYNLLNINEDIKVIEEKLENATKMEEAYNLIGYSSYMKQALKYINNEKSKTL